MFHCLLGNIGQNLKRLLSYQLMKKFMSFPLLFIVLSFIYPASLLLRINSHIYTTDQIIVTLICVLLMSIITALAAGLERSF